MQKLYRININHFEDPLKNERLLDLVGIRRREKVIKYRMPDDRKRSLGAGIIIRKILDENGLTESCLRYSDNEKPVVDGLFFNVSHAGDYVVGVLSDCEVGCDIEKNANAPLEVAEHYFYHSELAYIKAAKNKDKAFFTLWTLKESYMKMTGRGMSLPLDSFEVVPTAEGFVLGKSSERPCFFETMEFDGYIFSVSSERAFSLRNPLEIAFDRYLCMITEDFLEFQSDRKAYMSDIASAVRRTEEGIGAGKPGVTGISGCCFPVLSVNSGSERFRDNRILLREIIVILIICIVLFQFPVSCFDN